MDIAFIRTLKDYLDELPDNNAKFILHNGISYETPMIHRIIEQSETDFEPLVLIDASPEAENDMVILPLSSINHLVIKGPRKDKKVGFFPKQEI